MLSCPFIKNWFFPHVISWLHFPLFSIKIVEKTKYLFASSYWLEFGSGFRMKTGSTSPFIARNQSGVHCAWPVHAALVCVFIEVCSSWYRRPCVLGVLNPIGSYTFCLLFLRVPWLWAKGFEEDISFRVGCSNIFTLNLISSCGSPALYWGALGRSFPEDGWERHWSLHWLE